MVSILIALFVIGYLAITLEHPLKLDKTVPALMTAAGMWAFLAVGFQNGWIDIIDENNRIQNFLSGGIAAEQAFKGVMVHHLASISEILVFLIGAMTIVELIDLHKGFSVVHSFVSTKSRTRLLWIVGVTTFFLSSVIDNMTATIVMVSLLRTLISDDERRIWYIGMVVIAANAGGAWSPIGDVTTTMLWIAEKVSAGGLAVHVIVPALVCFLVPFAVASLFLKPFQGYSDYHTNEDQNSMRLLSSRTMLFLGTGAIVFVPVFKVATDLPPYLGMMLGLAVVWLVSEYIRPQKNLSRENRRLYSAKRALHRIEMSSVLFFLGILLSVAALETASYGVVRGENVGALRYLAEVMQQAYPNRDITIVLLGLLSAVVDNVPIVAAAMGMFTEAQDNSLWHLIAYCAGTGGSMLIIGSAAGVAAMGMENISFGWYLRKITWLAALGFFAGVAAFIILRPFIV